MPLTKKRDIKWDKVTDGILDVFLPTCDVQIRVSHDKLKGTVDVQVLTLMKRGPDDRVLQSDVKADSTGTLTFVKQGAFPVKRPEDPMPKGHETHPQLAGKFVLLRQDHYAGSLLDRTVRAISGFGCDANAGGGKIYYQKHTGEQYYCRRNEIRRMSTKEEIAAYKKADVTIPPTEPKG